jgi:hypothetical protein
VLNRAFIHRRRWQRAAFTFVLGATSYFVGNSVFEQTALAQFRASSSSAVSDQVSATSQQFGGDPGTPEIPDQHRKPATITPVEPIAPKTGPITPKINQSIRNEIVEKHSEQLKSQECSRKLEQRRRALRQGRTGSGRR